jgi:hypothetical protein
VLIRLHGQGTRRRGRDPGFVQIVHHSDQRLEGKSSRRLTALVPHRRWVENLHETVEDMGIDALTTALELSAGVPTRTGYSLMRSMWKVPALVEEAIEHSGTAQQARLGVGRLYTQDW